MTKKNVSISVLILVLLGILLYSNTIKNPYVWDDKLFIQNSNFIKKFENIRVFFSPENYFKYTQDLTYRPFPFLVHIFNYKIWNTKPVGHRLTNILLHIASAVLIYFLVLYLSKHNFAAFLSGLFFLIHPVVTEVVNMVSFNETMLSNLFFLLSLLFYIKSKGNKNLYVISFVSYFLGIFSKETAITLPVVIILYDLIFEEKLQIKKYVPFLMIAIFYFNIRFLLFRHPIEPMINYPTDSFLVNLFTILKTVPLYTTLLFFPVNLSVEHRIIIPHGFFEMQVISGFLLVMFFIVISIYAYKKSKPLFFWLIFMLITFTPTSNIIPIQNIVSERYLYLPLVGFSVILALLIEKFTKIVTVFILIFFCILTFTRNNDWKDEFSFYSKTLIQNPDSPGANMNMCLVYAKKNDYKKALHLINYALKIDPNYLDGKCAMASIFQNMGDYEKALKIYQKIAELKHYSYHNAPFVNLGIIYKIKKQNDLAIENFNKAIELNPLSSSAYTHLGEIYEMQGDIDKATELYEKSVDINPDDYIPSNALGTLYGRKENYNMAILCFRRTVKLQPTSADAHFNLGYAYLFKGKKKFAIKELNTALKINPNHKNAQIIITQILKKEITR